MVTSRSELAAVRTPQPGSAKSMLLVVLGEFAWPEVDPVWSSTLIAALDDVGVEPDAARKALQRTAEDGLIEPVRDGRRVRWVITPAGHRLLSEGYHRVLDIGQARRPWDGRWLLVTVSVPESRRAIRPQLQRQLAQQGLGSPSPGLWLTPHVDRAPLVAEILNGHGLDPTSCAMVGEFAAIGRPHDWILQAWDLEAIAARYRGFMEGVGRLAPRTDADVLRQRVELIQEWRPLVYLDPVLPSGFLPPDWPGDEALTLFHQYRTRLMPRSDRRWRRHVTDSAVRRSA